MTDSFDFKLSRPISYAESGRQMHTDSVTVYAPGEELLLQSLGLSQLVHRAALDAAKSAAEMGNVKKAKQLFGMVLDDEDVEEIEKQETPEEAGASARMILMTSQISLPDATDEFASLACSGCLRINGNVKLNSFQWKEIAAADKLEIFFQFIGVFMVPSLFSAPKAERGSKKLEMKSFGSIGEPSA